MKKLVTLAVVAALALTVVGPADAKKKKKKPTGPVELQYLLRTDEDCAAPFLSLTDAEDGDCIYGNGGLADVYAETGSDWTERYVAADGLPLVLDVTRKVTGSIAIRGWNTYTGFGPAEIDITLLATIAGEEKELGAFSESYMAGPADQRVFEFEMELDPALGNATVEAMTLAVYAHGLTVGGRGVEHDEPVSSIKVPALQ